MMAPLKAGMGNTAGSDQESAVTDKNGGLEEIGRIMVIIARGDVRFRQNRHCQSFHGQFQGDIQAEVLLQGFGRLMRLRYLTELRFIFATIHAFRWHLAYPALMRLRFLPVNACQFAHAIMHINGKPAGERGIQYGE